MKRDLLVIEKDTRDSLASRLSTEGYSVCLASTGAEALEVLSRHSITHAVILNAISMRSNGARTCAALKRTAPGFPVLIYSDREKPAKADVLLRPGISTRKLINRVELYSPYNSTVKYSWTRRNNESLLPRAFPICLPRKSRS